MRRLLLALALLTLAGCRDMRSPTEPRVCPAPTPTPTPTHTQKCPAWGCVTPTPVHTPVTVNVLQGHFIGDNVSGIAVTVTQDHGAPQVATTDATGFYIVSGLVMGPASVIGVAKSGCCRTGLATQIHAGVNVLDVPVLFLEVTSARL